MADDDLEACWASIRVVPKPRISDPVREEGLLNFLEDAKHFEDQLAAGLQVSPSVFGRDFAPTIHHGLEAYLRSNATTSIEVQVGLGFGRQEVAAPGYTRISGWIEPIDGVFTIRNLAWPMATSSWGAITSLLIFTPQFGANAQLLTVLPLQATIYVQDGVTVQAGASITLG